MGKHVLFTGSSPSAVSEAAFDAAVRREEDDRVVHVVPTVRLARAFRRRKPGWAAMPWRRFVEKLARRAPPGLALIDPAVRRLLVEQLLAAKQGYGALVPAGRPPRPGVVGRLSALFADLLRHQVSSDDLATALARSDRPLHRVLPTAYGDYLYTLAVRHLVDPAQIPTVLAQGLRQDRAALAGLRLLVLDNLLDLGPADLALVRAIASDGDVWLALPAEVPGPAGALARRAAGLARDLGATIRPVPDERARRTGEALFRSEPAAPVAGPALRVVEANDVEDEVHKVATAVERLVRERTADADLSDVAVVIRNVGAYAALVREVFPRYRIPFSITLGVPMRESSAVATALLLVEVVARDYAWEPLLRLLSSPFCRFRAGEQGEVRADWVERLVRRAGRCRGRAAWRERLDWFAQVTAAEEKAPWWLPRLQDGLPALLDALARLEGSRPLSAHVETLRALLRRFGIGRRAVGPAGHGAPQDEVEREARALAGFERLLDREAYWAELNDPTPVGPTALLRRLQGAVAGEYVKPAESERKGVQVLGALETRGAHFEHVVVAGLVEGVFPQPDEVDPWFAPGERAELGLPAHPPRLWNEAALFHGLLGAGDVVLVHPRTDTEGRPLVRSLFVELAARNLVHDASDLPRAGTPRDVQVRLGSKVGRGTGDALAIVAALAARDHVPWLAEALRGIAVQVHRDADPRRGPWAGELADTVPLAPWGADHVFSPTRLERYRACPFRFFAEEVLGLRPPPEPTAELDPADRGRLVHRILARFYAERKEPGFPDVLERSDELARIKAIAEEEYARAAFADPLSDLERDRFLGGRGRPGLLQRFLKSEVRFHQEEDGAWSRGDGGPSAWVEHVEWTFEPFDLARGEGPPVRLAGRVDRVDRLRRRFRYVLDYKSGGIPRPLDKAIERGLHLQIPLYVLALAQDQSQPVAGGALYQVTPGSAGIAAHLTDVDGPFYGTRNAQDHAEFEALLATARAHALSAAADLRAGRFPVTDFEPREAGCPSCPARRTCRSTRAWEGSRG